MHGNNNKNAADSLHERDLSLKKCKSKASVCRNYALGSVDQNHMAEKFQCTFKPPVWSNNDQMHYE